MEFVRSGRAEIAYEASGDGPGVLLIHAGVNDRRSWRPLIEHLGDGYRCVALDLRSFGDTRYEHEEEWVLSDDALAVMDAAGLDRPVVVAGSMGGLVALDLALAAPGRVAGLVLIGPAVRGAPEPELDPDGPTAKLFAAIGAAEEAEDLEEVLRLEERLWLDGASAPERRVTDEPTRALFTEMNRRAMEAGDSGEPMDTVDVWPYLEEIDLPALVLTGTFDAEHLLTLNPELARRLPQGRHAWLEGVGHVPQLEGDPATLAAIAAFLAEVA